MTKEERFIASLLCASRNEQQQFIARALPLSLFDGCHEEVDWLRKHFGKHHKMPSVGMFKSKYPDLDVRKVKDPIEETLQVVLDMKMFSSMRKETEGVQERIDSGERMADVLSTYKRSIQDIQDYTTSFNDVNMQVSTGAEKEYRALRECYEDPSKRLLISPWQKLNRAVLFFRPKEVWYHTARMGMGKSWTMVELADFWAKMGFRVLLVSLEMSSGALEQRLTCKRYGLSYVKYREADFAPKDLRRWRREMKKKEDYPITVTDDSSFLTTSGIGLLEQKIAEHKPQVVICDGAYKFRPAGVLRNATEPNRLALVSSEMVRVAKDTNTFLVATLQDNRENEQGKTTKGGLSKIFGSDAWAQDADWLTTMSGERGSDKRLMELLKGRESMLVSFYTRFQLDPRPEFHQLASQVQKKTEGSPQDEVVEFKGAT